MKTLKMTAVVLATISLLTSCANTEELEQRVEALEKKVENLSATSLVTNPATATTPTQPEVKPEGPLPAITFAESEFNFGDINQGEIVEHIFKFTNSGDAPLIIENASASCGCTVPEWPKDPIQPGGTGEIKVQFDSKGKVGQQNKQVTIRANTYPNMSKVNILSNVIAPTNGPEVK